MSTAPGDPEGTVGPEDRPVKSNTVAFIGFILACLSAVLLVLLLWFVGQLPDDIESFQQRFNEDTLAQLRLLILGCSIAVLTLVAFALSVAGLFMPQRSRLLAGIGTIMSFLILSGVFGVLLTGALMNSAPTVDSSATGPAEGEILDEAP